MNLANLPTAEPLLGAQTVADAMHHGIVTCPPSATLREVAELLAENGVHCAVVAEPGEDGPPAVWGIVSDIELMRGLGSPVALTAGNLAALDVVTIRPDEQLGRAAQLLGEHDIAHLIVVEGGAPVGILSTLDIAKAVART